MQESEHGDDGGDHCETTLEAKSTANHCGGTVLLSDWRAWAVELGLGEINGLMVLVPGTRPCQLERGVVRRPRVWNAVWNAVWMRGMASGCAEWPQIRVPKTQARVARCRGVQAQCMCSEDQRRGHRESAGSSEADDGEGAEVDSALLVRDRGLVLLLGASLGLLLDLDLERAELVVPSKEAVVLRRGGEEGWSCSSTFSSNWAAGRRVRRRAWVLGYTGSSSQRGIWLWGLAEARRSQCTDKGCGR